MSQELRQELAGMVGPTQWNWLKPHIARDAVVFVNPQLDLVEVGMALTTSYCMTRQVGMALTTS